MFRSSCACFAHSCRSQTPELGRRPNRRTRSREEEETRCLFDLGRTGRLVVEDAEPIAVGATDADIRPTGPAPRVIMSLARPHHGGLSLSFDLTSAVNTTLLVSVRSEAGAATAPAESLAVYAGRGHYDMGLFTGATNTAVCIGFPAQCGPFALGRLRVHCFPSALYEEAAAARRASAFRVTEFRDDRLAGSITASAREMLFLAIPFNSGWSARRNGRPVRVQEIDMGFVGIPLERG